MSKQLAISAAFSIFMMATYVLFGGDSQLTPLDRDSVFVGSPVEISAPDIADAGKLLPLMR